MDFSADNLRSQAILQQAFPQLYVDDVRKELVENDALLFPTFLALHKAIEDGDKHVPRLRKKVRVPKTASADVSDAVLDDRIRAVNDAGELEALMEFRAARAAQLQEQSKVEDVKRREQQELENFDLAKAEGNVADCGCCFVEYAINRMVHCDGDVLHVSSPDICWPVTCQILITMTRICQWFCQDCARMMAETQIGMSKHQLDCMSTDGCSGGFSRQQREIFLDEGARTALERIEAEAALREAGIENLETCPFCSFAMVRSPFPSS